VTPVHSGRGPWRIVLFGIFLGLALCPLAAGGQAPPQPQKPRDLTDLSIDELMQVQVTSASKKEQRLSHVAAAVYVITQEDIRRSGVTSIPEALRLAPGVQVARIDASKWAISIRGFNGRFANKLLVLIDGRSVYTPEFGGVYWGVQDTLMDDIERIEVIRGPGATMWGANAVNGVVNVITKRARDTQGGLLVAGGGSEELGFAGVRSGGRAGRAYYRGYSKFFERNHLLRPSGQPGADDWNALRGGFRVDWDLSEQDGITFQGDLYRGTAGVTAPMPLLLPPYRLIFDDKSKPAGGNLLGR
jgi:iron complex outermembrane recepter protein